MKLRDRLLAGYFVICALGLIWPGYAWLGNRIEPYILGLPLSFAWVVGWVLVTLLVLVAYDITRDQANP